MTACDYKKAMEAIVSSFRQGGKLLLCGNGGSAADCAHIVGELAKSFVKERPIPGEIKAAINEPWADRLQRGLPAIDLTCNNALISAVINDIDGESVYAQQVIAYGRPGDVLIGISTSGNAENVRRAMKAAQAMGMTAIALTGTGGGRLAAHCDILLDVNARVTAEVQELHMALYHQLCMDIEDAMF